MKQKIIIIEDEEDIRQLIKDTLEAQGYEVLMGIDGAEGISLVETYNQDSSLIILDLMLPKIDGMSVLKRIRAMCAVPVLILSAKDGEYDKILGLELGADDYLTKPFSLLELQARVKALLRRNNEYQEQTKEQTDVVTIGDLTIELTNYIVYKNGVNLNLTAKEFQILHLFVMHPKKVYTKNELYQQIWNDEFLHDENVLNVHIRRLRKKIEDDPSNPQYIQTIWGIGYTWKAL